MTSPTLANAIDVVRSRIQKVNASQQTIGEQNTKASLIEPILHALGWNLQEIDEVRREFKARPQDNPVDYALFVRDRECLFIEAKSLEKDLADRKWISQNLSYATVVGVKWCALTNGDEYRIYNSHAPVDVDQKLFRSVRVSDVATDRLLLSTLSLLSRESMERNAMDAYWEQLFLQRGVANSLELLLRNQDSRLIELIQSASRCLTGADVRAGMKALRLSIDCSATEAPHQSAAPHGSQPLQRSLVELIESGVIKAPLIVEREYKGHRLSASILPDGRVEFAGKVYDSLSTAAAVARNTANGNSTAKLPATNGWSFWQMRDEVTGKTTALDELRKRAGAVAKR